MTAIGRFFCSSALQGRHGANFLRGFLAGVRDGKPALEGRWSMRRKWKV